MCERVVSPDSLFSFVCLNLTLILCRDPCSRFSREIADNYTAFWQDYHSQSLCATYGCCPPMTRKPLRPRPPTPAFFSHFRYRKECNLTGSRSRLVPAPPSGTADTYDMVVEPLVGPLRHPLYCFNLTLLEAKDYMFFSDPWLPSVFPTPMRFFYFDAGASSWDMGTGGASQSWMVAEFTSRWCFQVAGVWAWEIVPQETKRFFSALPPCLPPVYHWFNVAVSPEPSNKQNIWKHLEAVAKPEDFVLVKIDIDHPPTEIPLLRQLLATPSLQALVDELFFEHHVNFFPICQSWGTCSDSASYKDSLDLFTTLRKQGIRAHSWV